MNLISKEFCAARTDNLGVLILSKFAGAARELRCGALVVNPHHIERLASVLHFALLMDEAEQNERMELMRSHIRRHDVFGWARSFLGDGMVSVFPEITNLNPANSGCLLQTS
jgi:trehalose 6-phosphate synthase